MANKYLLTYLLSYFYYQLGNQIPFLISCYVHNLYDIYTELVSDMDLYIQNITVSEHDSHSDSFEVKFPNVFANYMNEAVRFEDKKCIDWENYKFTLWQTQLNVVVFCASSACGVSVEHMHAKKPMIRSLCHFHVYYHIRKILKILEIPLPIYENSFN